MKRILCSFLRLKPIVAMDLQNLTLKLHVKHLESTGPSHAYCGLEKGPLSSARNNKVSGEMG